MWVIDRRVFNCSAPCLCLFVSNVVHRYFTCPSSGNEIDFISITSSLLQLWCNWKLTHMTTSFLPSLTSVPFMSTAREVEVNPLDKALTPRSPCLSGSKTWQTADASLGAFFNSLSLRWAEWGSAGGQLTGNGLIKHDLSSTSLSCIL